MISIITPAFNVEPFVEGLIASVLGQTWGDWEWIIVNDGSTDATASLLQELDDPRIEVIHQANAGASAARNVGLDHARGKYVTFLDADDLLPPQALGLRAAFLDDHPDVDIVNGGVRVTSDGKTLRHYRPDTVEGPLLDRLAGLQSGVFLGPFYMIRRERIGAHRFPTDVSHCEDLIFFLTLAHDMELRYGAVAETIYEYRVRPDSAMSNLDGLEAGYLAFLQRAAHMERINPAMRRYQKRRIARILFRSWLRRGRPLKALAASFKVRAIASIGLGGNE